MTRLLHAEWTKFRTVRGWIIAIFFAAAVIVGLGLLPGESGTCDSHNVCALPVGPEGQEVTDAFSFVHQPLAGNGTITVRVAALTSDVFDGPGATRPALVPWAKAGLIVKVGTRPGSAYAALMLTGAEGTRMQYDYVHDKAGSPGRTPRWLRLSRDGDSVTGAESADGVRWTTVGTAHLHGLPGTVEVGLFVTSPQFSETMTGPLGMSGAQGGPSRATATFDHLDRTGTWPAQAWTDDVVGGAGPGSGGGSGFEPTADGFTVRGSGDIAPAVAGASGLGTTITQTLVGTFAGLIVVIVVGTMFVTAEYRRGLIRTTLSATPGRGRILAAKAVVVGAVSFLAGLVAAAAVVAYGPHVLRAHGVYVHAAARSTEARLVVGTAALLAVAAVLGLAIGALLRRGAAAVTVAVLVIVFPYLLAMSVLPAGAARWVLRVTPAAAFAVQQSTPQYHQVANLYTPNAGYFPLAPWAGFAVLCGWTALALGLATWRLRRRDA